MLKEEPSGGKRWILIVLLFPEVFSPAYPDCTSTTWAEHTLRVPVLTEQKDFLSTRGILLNIDPTRCSSVHWLPVEREERTCVAFQWKVFQYNTNSNWVLSLYVFNNVWRLFPLKSWEALELWCDLYLLMPGLPWELNCTRTHSSIKQCIPA